VGKTDGSVVVADAGPLIHLDELHSIHLLETLAPVIVPEAVWSEVMQHRPVALKSKLLTIQAPTQPGTELEALAKLYSLHLGEIQAISICHNSPHSRLLTDDTAARMAAKALGIPANGTLGVILRALRLGSLNKNQTINLLEAIPASSSLHIKRALLAEIINDVRNY
jgi:predicted nucleic acid-binding protein